MVICYAGGRWVEVAGGHMKCWNLILLVSNLRSVLSVAIVTGYWLDDLGIGGSITSRPSSGHPVQF
jgi:hypothetical protein